MLKQLIREFTTFVNGKLATILLVMSFMGFFMSWVYDESNPAGWTIVLQSIIGIIVMILNVINSSISFKERYDKDNQKKTK